MSPAEVLGLAAFALASLHNAQHVWDRGGHFDAILLSVVGVTAPLLIWIAYR